ncbi:hypothetical protein [Halobacteriovorax sp. HLS]|uniref:hypothetical protein n=1 Tax=Halobacteriovorax sp. HLS TaxID=2234000 RepID=UPI000FD9BE75|nr:hypothetical protein [Halobacteriovorax sp. HLS]
MKSFKSKFILLFFACVGLGLIYYLKNNLTPELAREHHGKEALVITKKESIFQKKNIQQLKKLSPTELAKKSDDYNREEFNKLMKALIDVEASVKERQKVCSQTLNNVLPNDDYLDINTIMYNDFDSVVENFRAVLNGAMYRPEVDQGFTIIHSLIEEEYPIDPLIMYKRLERLDICRDPKALNFVDTVFEAYRLKKWPKNVGNQLILESFELLTNSLRTNKSVENLLYFNNLILVMADNEILPKTYLEDLEDLGRRMNDNHNIFKESFGPRHTREKNLMALSDYLRRNDEYATDLLQHVTDLKYQLEIK